MAMHADLGDQSRATHTHDTCAHACASVTRWVLLRLHMCIIDMLIMLMHVLHVARALAHTQVFSVALSGPLLGVAYPAYVWLSLLPIVAGCAMSAMKEVGSWAHGGEDRVCTMHEGQMRREGCWADPVSGMEEEDALEWVCLGGMGLSLMGRMGWSQTMAERHQRGPTTNNRATTGTDHVNPPPPARPTHTTCAGQLCVERLQQRHDLQPGHGAAQHLLQEVACRLQGRRGPCFFSRASDITYGFAAWRNGKDAQGAGVDSHLGSHGCSAPPPCVALCMAPLHEPVLPPAPQHIDGINLFGLISIVSLLYCAPAAVVMEGSQWAGAWQVSNRCVCVELTGVWGLSKAPGGGR